MVKANKINGIKTHFNTGLLHSKINLLSKVIIIFQSKGEIKLKVFFTRKPALQQMLKEVLWAERE